MSCCFPRPCMCANCQILSKKPDELILSDKEVASVELVLMSTRSDLLSALRKLPSHQRQSILWLARALRELKNVPA